MDLRETAEDRTFRAEIRTFLEDSLNGPFAVTRGRGGPGDEGALFEERREWERHLGAHGWTCVGWPKEHGGRGLPLRQQVIYHEEYARARAPGRLGIVGEGLLGPTLIAFGTPEQQRRFLPPIVAGEELWCQGYSEPGAGSDLAALSTTAVRDGDGWVIHGQKVWTSLAHWADWCFVLARTPSTDAPSGASTPTTGRSPRTGPAGGHAGDTGRDGPPGGGSGHGDISCLLVPMRQPGVEIRPIVQMTGDSEFNEVFFDGARASADHVVGGVGNGWRVAMGTLAFERGASTLGQQLNFRNELAAILATARRRGLDRDPVTRQRLVRAHIALEIMRLNALRMLSGTDDPPSGRELGPAAMTTKLYWAITHRDLGELAMDVLGAEATVEGGTVDRETVAALQRLFLFSRADTIYGGTNQIQRNIIGERALGLPREPR